jgi:hypothetical protein
VELLVGGVRIPQELRYDAAGNLERVDQYGDMNCDGVVDFKDNSAFTLALMNPTGYAQTYPNCDILLGDINGNGVVGFEDINPFVALLSANLPKTRRYDYDEENSRWPLLPPRQPGIVQARRDAGVPVPVQHHLPALEVAQPAIDRHNTILITITR